MLPYTGLVSIWRAIEQFELKFHSFLSFLLLKRLKKIEKKMNDLAQITVDEVALEGASGKLNGQQK